MSTEIDGTLSAIDATGATAMTTFKMMTSVAQAGGFMSFPLQSPGKQIYVANAGSNSNNGLTPSTPVQTIAHAVTLLTSGNPDQLLLNRGDTFTEVFPSTFNYTGTSATQPMLLGTYGAGNRPVMQIASGNTGFAATNGVSGQYLAIQGINFYCYQRDPSNGAYLGTTTVANDGGTSCLVFQGYGAGKTPWIYIEDCQFSFSATHNVVIQTDGNAPGLRLPGFTINFNRNIVQQCFSASSRASGLYMDGFYVLNVTGNVFDHCGWAKDAALQAAGCGANSQNRNIYIQGVGTGLTLPTVTVQGNVFNQGSSIDVQFRPGGTILDNIWLNSGFAAFSIGENNGTSGFNVDPMSTAIAQRNVILQVTDSDIPGGFGIQMSNCAAGNVIQNNIIAHCKTANVGAGNNAGYYFDTVGAGGSTCANQTPQNNIIFDYPHLYQSNNTNFNVAGTDAKGNVVDSTTYVDLAGTNTGSAPEPFPHPSPTASGSTSLIDDYWVSLGNSIVNNKGLDFVAACCARAPLTWNNALSAYGANDYVQTGFGVSYRS